MALLSLPYDRESLEVDLDDARIAAILSPAPAEPDVPAAAIMSAALDDPIGSPRLSELARGKRRVVVITSDHTRPMPSGVTLPMLLAEIRRGNPAAEVSVLVATGTHRPMTQAETTERFGPDLVREERIISHRSSDQIGLVEIGRLPSGVPLAINRLAAEADLLVAEGFIEPHFFAGFSGGPKSILPGIAGDQAIRANHSGQNVADARARVGRLEGNPIHQEMEAAADLARLAFILNVVLGKEGRIAAAFAGDFRAAHARGSAFVAVHARVSPVCAPIAITSNGGYPLDQNLYQAVKGMTTAEAMTAPGGRIIMVAGCRDGIGGESFARLLEEMGSPAEFFARAQQTPAGETAPDLWEAQILARVLRERRVTLVTGNLALETRLPKGLSIKASLQEALDEALDEAGQDAKVTVIPDGVAVIPG